MRRYLVPGLLTAVGVAAAISIIQPRNLETTPQLAAAEACPAGYVQRDPLEVAMRLNAAYALENEAQIRERFGTEFCVSEKLPRSQAAKFAEADDMAGMFGTRDGATLRRAVEAKARAMPLQAKIANARGEWTDYGQGPQVSIPEYPPGNTFGFPVVAGRTDQFSYDPEARRLFAAVGNGGIWMSTATDGDLATLGDHWASIGGDLPTLVTSGVGWTPAGGGRVIALTGEHTQGGNSYVGLGAYWSDDLGKTWHHASGVPDGALGFRVAVDPAHPQIVYVATGKGLFRSEDAGSSYTNVALPVSEACAGVEVLGPCQFANFVTGIAIKHPGGSTDYSCAETGCPVLAAVGFRTGPTPYPDGTPQSPGNGLYRSDTGAAGSFARVGTATPTGLAPAGFAPNARIGRVELGSASGTEQNHDYVYAVVQDAVLLNGSVGYIDIDSGDVKYNSACQTIPASVDPLVKELCTLASGGARPSVLNGIYASDDFGTTWTRLTDDTGLVANAPASGSTLAALTPLGIGPGIQSWYNAWIAPDPTQQLDGIPTRLAFGLEELWQNRGPLPPLGAAENTPLGWDVFGTYYAGETCQFLVNGAPACPARDGVGPVTTTHPDQQDGLFIADPDRGGVWLFAGNDGGIYRQYSADTVNDPLTNTDWGDGANQDLYTLMNYGIGMAKDGTVYYGLQDNTSGKIDPTTRQQIRLHIADGIWAAVDPDNSDVAYYQTQTLGLSRTTDGGRSNSSASLSGIGTPHFLSPFAMDPQNAAHLVAVGTAVGETLNAPDEDILWTQVFDLGTNPDTGTLYQSRWRSLDIEGAAVYAGYCGPCNVLSTTAAPFRSGIATNVGGELPPKSGTADGWHHAAAQGLPNRFIYGIKADPQDPQTVYVVLGGYNTARWAPPGQYLDTTSNLGKGNVYKSTDAGASFVDISGNLPEIRITSILIRGEQLIVGSEIGVFISSDLNGSQWTPLGSNLPTSPVNQLVLKPGDDTILLAGTFGRGVQMFDFSKASDDGSPGGTAGGATGGTSGGNEGGSDAGRFGSGSLSGHTVLLLLALVLLRSRRQRLMS